MSATAYDQWQRDRGLVPLRDRVTVGLGCPECGETVTVTQDDLFPVHGPSGRAGALARERLLEHRRDEHGREITVDEAAASARLRDAGYLPVTA